MTTTTTTTIAPMLKRIAGTCETTTDYYVNAGSYNALVQNESQYACYWAAGCGWGATDPLVAIPTGINNGQILRVAAADIADPLFNKKYYGDFSFQTLCNGEVATFGTTVVGGIPLGTALWLQATPTEIFGTDYALGEGEPIIPEQLYLANDFRINPDNSCPIDDSVEQLYPNFFPLKAANPVLSGNVSLGTLMGFFIKLQLNLPSSR